LTFDPWRTQFDPWKYVFDLIGYHILRVTTLGWKDSYPKVVTLYLHTLKPYKYSYSQPFKFTPSQDQYLFFLELFSLKIKTLLKWHPPPKDKELQGIEDHLPPKLRKFLLNHNHKFNRNHNHNHKSTNISPILTIRICHLTLASSILLKSNKIGMSTS
jgi:hypothetical protein